MLPSSHASAAEGHFVLRFFVRGELPARAEASPCPSPAAPTPRSSAAPVTGTPHPSPAAALQGNSPADSQGRMPVTAAALAAGSVLSRAAAASTPPAGRAGPSPGPAAARPSPGPAAASPGPPAGGAATAASPAPPAPPVAPLSCIHACGCCPGTNNHQPRLRCNVCVQEPSMLVAEARNGLVQRTVLAKAQVRARDRGERTDSPDVLFKETTGEDASARSSFPLGPQSISPATLNERGLCFSLAQGAWGHPAAQRAVES